MKLFSEISYSLGSSVYDTSIIFKPKLAHNNAKALLKFEHGPPAVTIVFAPPFTIG